MPVMAVLRSASSASSSSAFSQSVFVSRAAGLGGSTNPSACAPSFSFLRRNMRIYAGWVLPRRAVLRSGVPPPSGNLSIWRRERMGHHRHLAGYGPFPLCGCWPHVLPEHTYLRRVAGEQLGVPPVSLYVALRVSRHYSWT